MSRPTAAQAVAAEVRKAIANAVLFNDRVAAEVGMSHGDMQSLHLLQLHGPLSPGELSARSGLTTGAITAVIDRLERQGLAARRPHESDRRKVVVVPHDERIEAVLGPHYRDQAENLSRAVGRFSAEQLQTVVAFLAALNEPGEDETASPGS